MDADPFLGDVGVEPQDQSLVFAGLHAGMLREPPAAIGRPDEVWHLRSLSLAPGLEFENKAVVARAVIAGQQDVDPRSAGGRDVVFDRHLHVVIDIRPAQRT